MLKFASYFLQGLKSTLRLKNGVNFSYKGPWTIVYPGTVIDEWYVGDFCAAEYTIVVDLASQDKEIIKCLVVAGPDTATVTPYGRTNLGRNLVDISATINASKVQIVVDPAIFDDSTAGSGSKIIFKADYFYTINELTP
jgi:hypothetical protein